MIDLQEHLSSFLQLLHKPLVFAVEQANTKMLFRNLIAILSFFAPRVLSTKKPEYQHLPPLREQAKIQDGWRQERLDSVPALLEKHGVDAWLVRSMDCR